MKELKLKVNYFGAEKIILVFYLVLNLVALYSMNELGVYIGDAVGSTFNVSFEDQIIVFCIVLVTYLVLYQVYIYSSSIYMVFKKNALITLEWLLFLGTMIGWTGFILFDYGKAEHQSSLAFGFIFRLIPYAVFWILYVSVVPKLNVRSIFLIFNFIILKLAMGWTGMLLALFWVVFIRFYNNKKRSFTFSIFTLVFLVSLFFLAPFVYSIKFYIRYDGNFSFDYFFLLSKIISRLSVISNALYCYENAKLFYNEYLRYLHHGFYFFEPLTAIMPRSLLGLGGENLETIFVKLISGEFNAGVIFYLGLVGKLLVYNSFGIEDIGNVICIFIFLIAALILLSRDMFFGYARPFLFYVLAQLIVSGSLEELSYTLYGVIFLFSLSKVKIFLRRK